MLALLDWFASVRISWETLAGWAAASLGLVGLIAASGFWRDIYLLRPEGYRMRWPEVARACSATILAVGAALVWVDAVLLLEPFGPEQRLGLLLVSGATGFAGVLWMVGEWDHHGERSAQERANRLWEGNQRRQAAWAAEMRLAEAEALKTAAEAADSTGLLVTAGAAASAPSEETAASVPAAEQGATPSAVWASHFQPKPPLRMQPSALPRMPEEQTSEPPVAQEQSTDDADAALLGKARI